MALGASKLRTKSLERGFSLGKEDKMIFNNDFKDDPFLFWDKFPELMDKGITQPGREDKGKRDIFLGVEPRHAIPEEDDREYARPKAKTPRSI